jgi:hypothetical protein
MHWNSDCIASAIDPVPWTWINLDIFSLGSMISFSRSLSHHAIRNCIDREASSVDWMTLELLTAASAGNCYWNYRTGNVVCYVNYWHSKPDVCYVRLEFDWRRRTWAMNAISLVVNWTQECPDWLPSLLWVHCHCIWKCRRDIRHDK